MYLQDEIKYETSVPNIINSYYVSGENLKLL